MLVTSVSPADHMHRRAARGDVAAAFLHAGSIAAALLHAGSIAVALLHAARALSVQKRYANEWDVQKRHGSEQDGGRCGARGGTASGVSAASGTVRRAGRHSEESGSANAAHRQRKAPACGDTRAPRERVRGHDAPG